MQTDVKQVFYFHADANSLGGFLEEPYRPIPTPCSVSLSAAGGSVTSGARDFQFEANVHATLCHTHVSGRQETRNGPWIQRAVATVQGLNLLGRVRADHVISQVHIYHPAAGGGPRRVSFAGSRFVNLTVDGALVRPQWNATLLPEHQRDADAYNQDSTVTPELEWPALSEIAYRQGAELSQTEALPAWARERFGWMASNERTASASPEGYTLCSLVDKIEGLAPELSYGHFIEVPDLGRLFFGEMSVFPHAVSLTMFRAELGCNTRGQASAASVNSNGTTYPPN